MTCRKNSLHCRRNIYPECIRFDIRHLRGDHVAEGVAGFVLVVDW
jgi:hypothetical protein